MSLHADHPHNKIPVYQFHNRDIVQGQIVEGELHVPHREVIITFFRLTYEPVPLPSVRTA